MIHRYARYTACGQNGTTIQHPGWGVLTVLSRVRVLIGTAASLARESPVLSAERARLLNDGPHENGHGTQPALRTLLCATFCRRSTRAAVCLEIIFELQHSAPRVVFPVNNFETLVRVFTQVYGNHSNVKGLQVIPATTRPCRGSGP